MSYFYALFFLICVASANPEVFNPEDIFAHNSPSLMNYAVVIMNRNIDILPKYVIPLWDNAAVRVTIDDGTDFWIKYLEKNQISSSDIKPIDLVSGNFNSITPQGMQFAEAQGAKVVRTPDAGETDFTDSLKVLAEHVKDIDVKLEKVVVLHQTSGRPDHILVNYNTLMMQPIKQLYHGRQIFMLSDESLTWIVNPGKSVINIPLALQEKPSWCSLIPLGQKCDNITTTGLRWNLDKQSMEFGGLISTSNKYKQGAKLVEIDSTDPILWSMGIESMIGE